jgi:hypothetical protein
LERKRFNWVRRCLVAGKNFIMKVKYLISFLFFWGGSLAYGNSSDSLRVHHVTHHFQLLIGNYVGESFFGLHNNGYKPYYAPPGQINYGGINENVFYSEPKFTPLYSYAVGFSYEAILSPRLGLSTGATYFSYGYIAEGTYDPCPQCEFENLVNPDQKYKRVIFVSSLQLPLHLNVRQAVKRGRFIFSTGPDLYLPINAFGKESIRSVYQQQGPGTRNLPIHYHVNGIDFFRGGSIGASLGIGYEKILSKKLIIELLPDVHFLNLVPFDFEGQGKSIYQNYIFNATFGLSTYLTFTR